MPPSSLRTFHTAQRQAHFSALAGPVLEAGGRESVSPRPSSGRRCYAFGIGTAAETPLVAVAFLPLMRPSLTWSTQTAPAGISRSPEEAMVRPVFFASVGHLSHTGYESIHAHRRQDIRKTVSAQRSVTTMNVCLKQRCLCSIARAASFFGERGSSVVPFGSHVRTFSQC